MRRYALIRTLSLVPTLLGVSVAVFLLIRLIPGTIVDQMILSRLEVTAELTLLAMLVAIAVGIPLGILSARRESTALD